MLFTCKTIPKLFFSEYLILLQYRKQLWLPLPRVSPDKEWYIPERTSWCVVISRCIGYDLKFILSGVFLNLFAICRAFSAYAEAYQQIKCGSIKICSPPIVLYSSHWKAKTISPHLLICVGLWLFWPIEYSVVAFESQKKPCNLKLFGCFLWVKLVTLWEVQLHPETTMLERPHTYAQDANPVHPH